MTQKPEKELIPPLKAEAAILATMKLLIDGWGRPEIVNYLKKKGKKLDPEKIIDAALARFAEIPKAPPEIRLGFCQEATRELFRKMVSTGDYAGALRAIQEFAKLTNAHAAAKALQTEPKGKPAPPAGETPNEPATEELLDELTAGKLRLVKNE